VSRKAGEAQTLLPEESRSEYCPYSHQPCAPGTQHEAAPSREGGQGATDDITRRVALSGIRCSRTQDTLWRLLRSDTPAVLDSVTPPGLKLSRQGPERRGALQGQQRRQQAAVPAFYEPSLADALPEKAPRLQQARKPPGLVASQKSPRLQTRSQATTPAQSAPSEAAWS